MHAGPGPKRLITTLPEIRPESSLFEALSADEASCGSFLAALAWQTLPRAAAKD